MSPLLGVGVFQPGIAVVERDAAIERLIELDFCSRKTEAAVLGRDLEAAPVPLHDVVVANDAFVPEGTDALEIIGSGPPSFGGVARSARETAVVISDELAQEAVGRVDIAGVGQTQFTAQAILQHAPEAFDTAFGLGRLRGNEGDAELSQGAAELGGLALAGEFFLDGPVIVIADEDAAAISVEGRGHAEASEQALEQAKVAFGGFRRKELSGEDFAGSVVLHAQSGETRAAAFEPVVRRAVELHQFAFASDAQTALAMSGRATFAGRAETLAAQQAAEGFTAEREAFLLDQFFAKVMVIEAGITGAGQLQDVIPHALGQATMTGPTAAGVCQSRLAALP